LPYDEAWRPIEPAIDVTVGTPARDIGAMSGDNSVSATYYFHGPLFTSHEDSEFLAAHQ
jgi:hypothetical protein